MVLRKNDCNESQSATPMVLNLFSFALEGTQRKTILVILIICVSSVSLFLLHICGLRTWANKFTA
jgi:hypothetical protein